MPNKRLEKTRRAYSDYSNPDLNPLDLLTIAEGLIQQARELLERHEQGQLNGQKVRS